MSTTIATDRLRALIAEELPELIALRHDLHAHPELGYEEHRTSEVIQRELEGAGIDFARNLAGGTGVMGHLPAAGDITIGLRADMDALPITEENDLDYRSTNPGVMHACGHDGHVTMLVGAARLLAKIASEQDLPRPVTFVFQPAEEGGAGGRKMVEDGCLTGNVIGEPIEHMFGLHGWPWLPVGVVGTRSGPLLAAADFLDVTVTGTGSHAAWPHQGRDPILAAAAFIQAAQQVASRNVDPLDAIVVSITQVHAGTTHNIIPDRVEMHGTVRILSEETQGFAIRRLKEIGEGIGRAHDCKIEVEYSKGYPPTVNDPEAVAVFNATARAVLGEDRVVEVPDPFMGGEDFAFYCREVPSCFFLLGLRPAGAERMPDLHQPTFNFNDEAIATGVELFCRLALREHETQT
ncbi:MAG: amidohydrolase [Planctomycetota bacterium]|nr:amidohydrolase [Planctomycetota bacterium]